MTSGSKQDQLAAVLDNYALGELRTAHRVRQGFVNDNWVVTTEQGRFFLKRRHPDLRQSDIIRAQHDLMHWLCQRGFPVPRILPTLRNETLLILGAEFYEIQEYVAGEPYQHDRLTHLEEAALTLARYHTCVQGCSPRPLRELGDLYSPALLKCVLTDLIASWQLAQNPDLAPIIQRLDLHAVELAACFAGHGPLPGLVIHGDYYAGNLIFNGDRIVGVVDYDKARWQPRAVELAEALIYFASPRPGHLKHLVYPGFLVWDPFVHFLKHYALIANLEDAELRAIPDYVRCIWLQMSVLRLLERSTRPSEIPEALQEVLALADWAKANTPGMIEAGRSVGAIA